MTHKDTRDGNWQDEWGSCRVCGGEIPYGHTDNCDIFKSEKKIRELEDRNALLTKLLKEYGIELTKFNAYVSNLVGRENEGERIDVLIEYVKSLQQEIAELRLDELTR